MTRSIISLLLFQETRTHLQEIIKNEKYHINHSNAIDFSHS